jgi:hypothetical protein
MKKRLMAIVVAVFAAGTVSAQMIETNLEQEWEWERKRELANRAFTNIAFSMQSLIDPETGLNVGTSDWGAAFIKGRSYTLHHRPVARMIYFGIDAVWADLNYAQYADFDGRTDVKYHHAALSMGLGPAVHIMPVKKLGIHTYLRFQPTIAALSDDNFETLRGGYAPMFTTGGAVSWSAISVGIEARWGKGDYKLWSDEESGEGGYGRLTTSGSRVYVSLRF